MQQDAYLPFQYCRSESFTRLTKWNDTALDYDGADRCIHELFEEQVRKSPEAVAVGFQDAYLDYAELNRRSNRLAKHLRALGVRPDARVAICLERSFEMVTALLAVLKAGGAYVLWILPIRKRGWSTCSKTVRQWH